MIDKMGRTRRGLGVSYNHSPAHDNGGHCLVLEPMIFLSSERNFHF